MLPYEVYKLVHIFGIVLTFAALGGLTLHALNGGTKADNQSRKLMAISHGVGLFLVLLGGFGMLARLGLTSGWPGWVHGKITLWLLVGLCILIPNRMPKFAKVLWFVLPLLATAAAAFAVYKPGGMG